MITWPGMAALEDLKFQQISQTIKMLLKNIDSFSDRVLAAFLCRTSHYLSRLETSFDRKTAPRRDCHRCRPNPIKGRRPGFLGASVPDAGDVPDLKERPVEL